MATYSSHSSVHIPLHCDCHSSDWEIDLFLYLLKSGPILWVSNHRIWQKWPCTSTRSWPSGHLEVSALVLLGWSPEISFKRTSLAYLQIRDHTKENENSHPQSIPIIRYMSEAILNLPAQINLQHEQTHETSRGTPYQPAELYVINHCCLNH